ncbi:hypothetical protein FP2506_10976 [Fulvimarina pelagi HTCC2506]|uniref:Inositolphosphotransferase Aur1/Ipt1 domain-containing protein n=1 Tax=Fulvimarina pelagi HTCC2506 TaxID=314231 RepID=Q0G4Q1_9HYPH|nr:phosphatase PAP2 family protein [Fulvimarina pelagi]EAU43363.1 hypothetical protein FP2506_10976 [Fulvimarina pelagi HTCC2506]
MISSAPWLRSSESLVATAIGLAAAIGFYLQIGREVHIETQVVCIVAVSSLVLIVTGLSYRVSGRSQSIGCTTIGVGLLMLFTTTLSIVNYLTLPLQVAPYDEFLVRIDALIGFHWPSVMEVASRYPVFCHILGLVYQSTMCQLAILVTILGLSGRVLELDRLLLTFAVSAVGVVAFWSAFPSLGTMAYYELDAGIVARIAPVVGPDYGLALKELYASGPDRIDPWQSLGLIAFPSFHTVLALMTISFARSVKWLFPFALALNLLMMPAVVIHGGHHLFDVFGGIVMFFLSRGVADMFIARFSLKGRRRLGAAANASFFVES